MKRTITLIGLAMITGLPHVAYAKSVNKDESPAYSSWNASYMPHYGAQGAEKPLMDHVSLPGQGRSNTWRLEFTPPPTVSNADDPRAATGIRAGFSLKLDF